MFKLGESLVWSATDLVTAARCEFALLSEVDRKLGRVPKVEAVEDPLMEQIGRLGTVHEEEALAGFEAEHGDGVRRFKHLTDFSLTSLEDAAEQTAAALRSAATVLYQPAFFDGDFFGYADFLRATPQGWEVCDAKLARQARPTALLQLAAYSSAIAAAGGEVAPKVTLLLGNGKTEEFARAELEAVFDERRDRLRHLLAGHLTSSDPVVWGQTGLLQCGSCAECESAAIANDDLIRVARLRMDQRRKLKTSGIHTVTELAAAQSAPVGMGEKTFSKLRSQARMQRKGAETGEVLHEIISQEAIQRLPNPSPGDLFFDFEGDPLYNEGDLRRWGLEYLWGVLTSPDDPSEPETFLPLWADDHTAEKTQLVAFLDDVIARLKVHPGLHIYHYAPYEVTALKRLTGIHETHQDVLDELLRNGVFVDLYAVVREAVLVSEPSYSIKNLEPLYLSQARGGEVTKGDASIAEYHEYSQLRGLGEVDGAAVARQNLLDYNKIDCVSTLELRDWLIAQVGGDVGHEPEKSEKPESAQEVDEELLALIDSLKASAGDSAPAARTPEEQTWAMLGSALGYHRREKLPSLWEHFMRLTEPIETWRNTPEVVCFNEPPLKVGSWEKGPGKRTFTRTLTALVELPVGSTISTSSKLASMYADPLPQELLPPDKGRYATGFGVAITDFQPDGDLVRITFTESLKLGMVGHHQLPAALVPGFGINDKPLVDAIREVVGQLDAAGELSPQSAIDVLARRAPRLTSGELPATGDNAADLTEALLKIDSSYLAVQGPPGTGKTYTGSEVITRLVRDHGWKVGVVAQSHAVVENFLSAVVKRGLDPDLIGKKLKAGDKEPKAWTEVSDIGAFVEKTPAGSLVGGTAWSFTGKFPESGLDLLVIDEAGQFSLANTIAVSRATERLLLLGDPQQLPQVSQGSHGEPVDLSALGWLMEGHVSLPRELGYFLEDSYRMHPAVCEPVSHLSYDGLLHSAPPASKRSVSELEPGLEVVLLSHHGNRTTSVEEAELIVGRIRELVGVRQWHDPQEPATPRLLGQQDVLVVAPYNAQRQLITRHLTDAGLGEVKVGTVDKFQGQEAPVVFVSMTASSAADVPRGMDFLLMRNRINVAISRAQWRAVLVRSEALTSYLPATTRGLLELGAFSRLCASGIAAPTE